MSFLNYRDMKQMVHKISKVPNHNIAENEFFLFYFIYFFFGIEATVGIAESWATHWSKNILVYSGPKIFSHRKMYYLWNECKTIDSLGTVYPVHFIHTC